MKETDREKDWKESEIRGRLIKRDKEEKERRGRE